MSSADLTFITPEGPCCCRREPPAVIFFGRNVPKQFREKPNISRAQLCYKLREDGKKGENVVGGAGNRHKNKHTRPASYREEQLGEKRRAYKSACEWIEETRQAQQWRGRNWNFSGLYKYVYNVYSFLGGGRIKITIRHSSSIINTSRSVGRDGTVTRAHCATKISTSPRRLLTFDWRWTPFLFFYFYFFYSRKFFDSFHLGFFLFRCNLYHSLE